MGIVRTGSVAVVAALLARSALAGPAPTLVAQVGHSGPVNDVAVSPDGSGVASAGKDGAVLLWEVATGRELHRLRGHRGEVLAVARSERHVLSGGRDGTARLWTPAGDAVAVLEGHTRSVQAVAVEGDRALTGGWSGRVMYWDLSGADPVGSELVTAARSVVAVDLRGATALVVTDREVGLWSLDLGLSVETRVARGVVDAAFTDDGVVLALEGAVEFLDAKLDPVASVPRRGSSAVASSGGSAWVASLDGQVARWDGNAVTALDADRGPTNAIAVGGDRVAVGRADGVIALYEAGSGAPAGTLAGQARPVRALAVGPGPSIAVADAGGTVAIWEPAVDRGPRLVSGHRAGATAVAWVPGGWWLTGDGDGGLHTWNASTLAPGPSRPAHEGPVQALAADRRGGIAMSVGERTGRAWSFRDGALTESSAVRGNQNWLTGAGDLTPDGRLMVTGGALGTVRTWAADGVEGARLVGHEDAVEVVDIGASGELVLTGSQAGTARLWDLSTATELASLGPHRGPVTAAALGPLGKLAATGDRQGTLWLWDLADPRPRPIDAHDGSVSALAWAPDGSFLASAGADGTTKLWGSDGVLLATLIAFDSRTWAVVDPVGRFDATEGGRVPGLHWAVGEETIALDRLKHRYYAPGLLPRLLGLTDEALGDVERLGDVALAPDVVVDPADAGGHTVVSVRDRGGGIGAVRVLVNGKEVVSDLRPRGASGDLELALDLSALVTMVPGTANEVRIEASNSAGYLTSRGAPLVYTPPGEALPPSLYAVVAGVSDYRGTQLDLQFAAADARAFASALEIAAGALFGPDRVHITVLADADSPASRANLADALRATSAAQPQDVVLVFLAGHGTTAADAYVFLTADAASADVGDPVVRGAVGVTSAEIGEWLRLSPANKQVMVLDTCASGAAVDALQGTRASTAERGRALERMRDRTGLFVLAGSASDAVSYEATQFGQGLLTWSLLSGMRGAALRDDQFVDVASWFAHAVDRVPELARSIGGLQQPLLATPAGGHSFDIGTLDARARTTIPLAEPMPVLVRSSFQHARGHVDTARVTEAVDAAVRDAAPGRVSFVSTSGYDGAWRLAGVYRERRGQLRATAHLVAPSGEIHVLHASGGTPGAVAIDIATLTLDLIESMPSD
jgi:WD40 repeat protein